jgi:hypothetical protein
MDYLSVLVVEAVEAVDQRRAERDEKRRAFEHVADARATQEDLNRAYEEAAGTWTGCDWHTRFGTSELDLKDWTSAAAREMARRTCGTEAGEEWWAAAQWLGQVEHHARQAEIQATLALTKAKAGNWREAFNHAQQSLALEFATGRPLRRGYPLAWQPLHEVFEEAVLARQRETITKV